MNVAEKLTREVARVTKLREQYKSMDGMPGVNVKPAMLMMDHALEQAKIASGQCDALAQIHALQSLEGFTG